MLSRTLKLYSLHLLHFSSYCSFLISIYLGRLVCWRSNSCQDERLLLVTILVQCSHRYRHQWRFLNVHITHIHCNAVLYSVRYKIYMVLVVFKILSSIFCHCLPQTAIFKKNQILSDWNFTYLQNFPGSYKKPPNTLLDFPRFLWELLRGIGSRHPYLASCHPLSHSIFVLLQMKKTLMFLHFYVNLSRVLARHPNVYPIFRLPLTYSVVHPSLTIL